MLHHEPEQLVYAPSLAEELWTSGLASSPVETGLDVQTAYVDDGEWQALPYGIVLPLAMLTDVGAATNLGLKLHWSSGDVNWDYYFEYVRPIGWNRGVGTALLMIRRLAVVDVGETPIYLGVVPVPTTRGNTAEFVEPMGNVRFQVSWLDAGGRIWKIVAKRL
jgi:hypothetical protein